VKGGLTAAASVLTAAAVLIPCGAWYVLGTRQIARETAQLEEAAAREALYTARQMATRVATRLDELRDQESERPYLHWWPQFLSRGESCDGLKPRTSPLSQGKAPRTIVAHFQLDGQGHLAGPRAEVDLRALDLAPPSAAQEAGKLGGQVFATVAPVPGPPQPDQEEVIQVSPFRWQTGRWKEKPALLALRQVQVAGETYTQGFVVNSGCLSHWRMSDGGLPASLEPGTPQGPGDAPVPIRGADWVVRVDATPALEQARTRAGAIRRQFHTSYAGGLFGALLAGGCVLVLVQRSGRLAQERARFAAAAAHELRTPLAGIRLHGEMLACSLGNPGRVREYAERITDEAERLGRLVTNVLNYSQVEERRLRLRREPGDLGATVREGLALVEPIVERSGAFLDLEIAPDLPTLSFDRDAVHQIVRNLVDNAEKYGRDAEDRHIEVSVAATADAVLLAVRDHGPGVPPALRGSLFEPFSRPDRDSKASGLGLGLSVVRTLARAHGGDVWHEETPGGGATFVVRLPV
jgi:signal transduction histidine kinase